MVFSVDCVSIQMTPIKYYITILPKFQVHLLLKITKIWAFSPTLALLMSQTLCNADIIWSPRGRANVFEIPFIMHLCVVITSLPRFKQLFIVLCAAGQYVIYRWCLPSVPLQIQQDGGCSHYVSRSAKICPKKR